MQTYRLYFLGSDGHFEQAEPFECADDERAIAVARTMADRRPMELWQQTRMVMVFSASSRSA